MIDRADENLLKDGRGETRAERGCPQPQHVPLLRRATVHPDGFRVMRLLRLRTAALLP